MYGYERENSHVYHFWKFKCWFIVILYLLIQTALSTMITNQTEHCVDRNRTNEEPDKTLIVRFSINSSLVLFSLSFSYRLLCCFRFSVYSFIFFYIFACFLEGKLKKKQKKPDQTKQKKKRINISIWATAHLPLP